LIPFAQAEAAVAALAARGAPVRFLPLEQISHYDSVGYVPALQQGIRWVFEQWDDAPVPGSGD